MRTASAPVRPGLWFRARTEPLDIAESFPTIKKSYVLNMHYMNNCARERVPRIKGPSTCGVGEAPVLSGLIGCEEMGERECR